MRGVNLSLIPLLFVTRHVLNQMFIIREINSDMPSKYKTNAVKNQMPRAGFEPKTPDLMKGALTTELP